MIERNVDTIFCFDSSALIILHRYYGQDLISDIWEELEQLFKDNKIISHKIVFDELTTRAKKQDSLSKWISSKRVYFKDITGTQAKFVESIINQFPRLIDPDREKDEADPWLIALVLEERSQGNLFSPNREYILVSQENVRRPRRKVRALFEYNGIAYLFAVTDPTVERYYRNRELGTYSFENPENRIFMCVSIGLPWENYCYKFVASLIQV
jgi:hypothetical protein